MEIKASKVFTTVHSATNLLKAATNQHIDADADSANLPDSKRTLPYTTSSLACMFGPGNIFFYAILNYNELRERQSISEVYRQLLLAVKPNYTGRTGVILRRFPFMFYQLLLRIPIPQLLDKSLFYRQI
ncbi:hypothetical protein WAI453_010148 [Rhynchosporium graminicola]